MRKLFVWDFHGTLCTGAERALKVILESVLERFGVERKISMQEILQLFGLPWGDYYRYLHPTLLQEQIDEMVELSRQLSDEIAPKYIKPAERVRYVLEEIKRSGDSNVVVSSTSPTRLTDFIEMIGIEGLISYAIGIPDEMEKNGGNPSEYKALKVKEFAKDAFDSIVVVGDRESDIEIGKLLNAKTFLLSENAAETKADKVISDLVEVLEVYDSQNAFQKQ